MKIGDIVELIEEHSNVGCYSKYISTWNFPIGTRFVIVPSDYSNKREPHGLQLLINGQPIPQNGRSDKAFVGVPLKKYKLVETETKTQKLLRILSDINKTNLRDSL